MGPMSMNANIVSVSMSFMLNYMPAPSAGHPRVLWLIGLARGSLLSERIVSIRAVSGVTYSPFTILQKMQLPRSVVVSRCMFNDSDIRSEGGHDEDVTILPFFSKE